MDSLIEIPRSILGYMEAALGFAIVWLFKIGIDSLRNLTKSVTELNEKIAVILTELKHHEKRLDDHDKQFRKIENGSIRARP